MSSQLKIAIIGAGPAGLTLGLLLHKRGIPFTIFERRQKLTDEELGKPAGSLDLHEGSGLAAIRECGLFDEFISLTGDCTEAHKISDKDGNILYQDEGESSNRPEISRHKIIKLLLSHLPASAINWSHKLICAKNSTVSGHTEIELDFGGKGKQTFDLVIGADGAWSRVRPLLTQEKPRYAGIQLITINIRQITTKHPHLAEFIGDGTFTALGNRHGVFSQRSVQDSARIYVFISTEDEHFAATNGLSLKTAAQAKDTLLGGDSPFSRWGASIKELVAVACDDESAESPDANIDIKPLYKLPAGHTWEHRPGATLIGDAAHLMNPPAGEGVNIAMEDSLLLSQAITKAHENARQNAASLLGALDPLIKEFEVGMAARATEMAEWTQKTSGMMFGGEDAARAMADWFKSFVSSPE
ncbi:hypothetical protein F4779DRAFT_91811 [Xylariaceae sp. FL0662B]|nr:hypothetical protein F4779DRAFT_91811 [Xylariaceae sp. FL0662B]